MFESIKCRISAWLDGLYDESDREFEEFFNKIEHARVKPARYIDRWADLEVEMKKKKRKTRNYPLEVTLSNGTEIIIPRQSQFKNEWLREHGCSLMTEYIALQYLGQHKIKVNGRNVGIYPVNLLKWHRVHTPEEVKAKVTVKGVAEGINELAGGKGRATYYKKADIGKIRNALHEGDIVIVEEGNPIHSVILLPDKDGIYVADHGKVEKADVEKIVKKATKDRKYRGMVIVTKEGKHE